MRKFLACLALVLCGCATVQDMDDELYKMHGLNEESAVITLGQPTKKSYVGNRKVLTWMRHDPEKVKTRGNIVSHGLDPETGQPIALPDDDFKNFCILKMVFDKDKVISHAFAGDKKGCEPWTHILQEKFGTDVFAFPD